MIEYFRIEVLVQQSEHELDVSLSQFVVERCCLNMNCHASDALRALDDRLNQGLPQEAPDPELPVVISEKEPDLMPCFSSLKTAMPHLMRRRAHCKKSG